jgi:hypothetical protein
MKGYTLAEAGRAYTGDANIITPAPLDKMVRDLSAALRNLAAEVIALSEQMHGGAGVDAAREPMISTWINDLRDVSDDARGCADIALKEMHRIRETIGL